jgi:hypothetical protein
MEMTELVLSLCLMLAVYLIIIIVFFFARRKYKGGLIATVINLVICTVGFLFVADLWLSVWPQAGLHRQCDFQDHRHGLPLGGGHEVLCKMRFRQEGF